MSFQLKGRVIFFATNNVNKFNEARMVFGEYKIAVGMLRVKTLEVQSDSLEEIAKTSVVEAFGKCNLPVIVEDAGLFVEALNGFPGPYAAYVYKTIGNKGLLQLMEKIENRKAVFQSAVAYYSSDLKSPICFKGEVFGEITRKEMTVNNSSGFGFDPIFQPVNSAKTFAEMTIKEKNRYSHRAKALRKFAEWYSKHQ
ncbi:MAG: XTP/dITP diphosphatase [Candidatus Bathyarchaeota archaeon]|nr:XTP/dITP diphosphatase [Candidatus Bathyarchaeota archaeon]